MHNLSETEQWFIYDRALKSVSQLELFDRDSPLWAERALVPLTEQLHREHPEINHCYEDVLNTLT